MCDQNNNFRNPQIKWSVRTKMAANLLPLVSSMALCVLFPHRDCELRKGLGLQRHHHSIEKAPLNDREFLFYFTEQWAAIDPYGMMGKSKVVLVKWLVALYHGQLHLLGTPIWVIGVPGYRKKSQIKSFMNVSASPCYHTRLLQISITGTPSNKPPSCSRFLWVYDDPTHDTSFSVSLTPNSMKVHSLS